MRKNRIFALLLAVLMMLSVLTGCGNNTTDPTNSGNVPTTNNPIVTTPSTDDNQNNETGEVELHHKNYEGSPFVAVNDNVPYFTDEEKENAKTNVFEIYSELDNLGRCGVAFANICRELMPTEDRESLSSVTPSGWKNKQYDSDLVDGGWIYNRAHIIGFQLAGEQANNKNLITGTRYFNVDGMLTFENMIADHIKESGGHVLYRVTPIYDGNNLVAEGVLMEAWSVEDNGESICFNVFCFNVQPGITINYATGDNWLDSEAPNFSENENGENTNEEIKHYILNTNSKKFHKTDCQYAQDISEKNKQEYEGTREDIVGQGYAPCGSCKP